MKLLTMIMHLVRSPIHHFLGGILVGLAVGWILFMFHKEPNDAYKKFYNRRVLIDIDTSLPANDMINTSVADQLSEDIRIICLVLTKPSNHFIKAVHIKSTWGKRCTKLVFASTQEEPVLPAIKLDIPEDRAHLWGKTKAALKHIYENYRGQYDWVYKADDDTFAVMENLRYLLHYSHPSEPVYYGCRLKLRREGLDYMSGGAGYALSREALRRFIEGLKCCSDTLISTHYVKPHELYLLEYLIYHVTPFGRAYRPVLDDNILAKSTNEGPTGEVTGSSSQRRQRSDFD
ncbi:glycoprotein-N-acetylgalactosamine 3-beta-galactosyltransferase 1-like isoform X3 [Euwallacea fornicatus]|uniref:glycoprotein-N-acetylgalactosamine 3-beta-galactosyltransferase 1-like isoform X3 n=1 Tax=Euwallacea fornicatus TaxID=995702 RepID=UPI00338FC544